MGANSSKHRYEYSHGEPAGNFDYYAGSRARGFGKAAPYYGQAGGMISAGNAGMYPQFGAPQPGIYPPVVYPMQQVSGPPVGQSQQAALQPQMQQQQQFMQMPQPQMQMQQMAGNPVIPSNPMPMPQLPMSQMPQPELQQQPFTQNQPQAQHPLSPGPSNGMFDGSMRQGQGMGGSTPIVPRSFARAPSSSTSESNSDSSRSERRMRERRRRERGMTDPLEYNPLPAPPRESETPNDILAGSAMAPAGPPLPRSSSPLRNPLPLPPRDVYKLRKYRPLLVGTAYADRQNDVFPRGWFSDEHTDEHEGGFGRVLERLNPFRQRRGSDYSPGHRRYDTMPELPRLPEFARESSESGSDSSYAPPGPRRGGLGRSFSARMPFSRRRAEGLTPMPRQGQMPPLAENQEPPVGFMPMPSPAIPGPTNQPQAEHPLSPGPPQPQLSNPLNPALQPGNPLSPGPSQSRPVYPRTPGPQGMPMPQPAQPLSPLGVTSSVGGEASRTQHVYPRTPGPQAMPMPQPGQPLSPMSVPQSIGGESSRPRPTYPRTPGPQAMPMPQSGQPLSPMGVPPLVAGEGPDSPSTNSDATLPVLYFDQNTPGYSGLCHLSPHRVLYKNKLYPTAAHLFEAHRFLGRRNDLAARVRKTKTLPELDAVLRSLEEHTRPDWEEVLIDKMEDALYHKIVQHEDLCEMLLGTGVAEIIYAEATDPFWGEGEHEEGANELGRILMRVRDRLKQEAEGR